MSFYTTSVCFCSSCCFDQHVRSIKIILQVGNKQWDQSLLQELKLPVVNSVRVPVPNGQLSTKLYADRKHDYVDVLISL